VAVGAAECALVVRETIGMDRERTFAFLAEHLKAAKGPFARLFLANRIAVDFERRAVPTLLDAATREGDDDVKCELLYCVVRYGDAATHARATKMGWGSEQPSESMSMVLGLMTPGRSTRSIENATWYLLDELKKR
jgi:hypothetical protein